mmetsp:Transcript_39937/g.94155  ORF Transcript_39937/g.94155 Transcript_39937/m.94155 type:complete len:278 (-) Transcript_39937:33-866(-)
MSAAASRISTRAAAVVASQVSSWAPASSAKSSSATRGPSTPRHTPRISWRTVAPCSSPPPSIATSITETAAAHCWSQVSADSLSCSEMLHSWEMTRTGQRTSPEAGFTSSGSTSEMVSSSNSRAQPPVGPSTGGSDGVASWATPVASCAKARRPESSSGTTSQPARARISVASSASCESAISPASASCTAASAHEACGERSPLRLTHCAMRSSGSSTPARSSRATKSSESSTPPIISTSRVAASVRAARSGAQIPRMIARVAASSETIVAAPSASRA